ncbi:hypothetical protein tb265_21040 [Gemmatimonadetes bacterium T265]|nr:hypothetical protein tb265_21040 [Gemmatimonadetes bacterium T265]
MTTQRRLSETVYHPPGTIRLATPAELAAADVANPAPTPDAAAPRPAARTADLNGVVAPALAPAEWDQALESPEAVPALLEQHVQAAAALPPEDATEHLRAALALANHMLPDDNPRKITWGTVDALRSALVVYHDAVGSTFGPLGVRRHPWRAMAATTEALGSLLPPREG